MVRGLPFNSNNSNATYNALFKENVAQGPHSGPAAFQLFPAAQITAFEGTRESGANLW
jgi:hypothetical protein